MPKQVILTPENHKKLLIKKALTYKDIQDIVNDFLEEALKDINLEDYKK